MMRKIQKKRKSSTDKEAAPEDMSADEDDKAEPDELEKTDSDSFEGVAEESKCSEMLESSDVWQHFAWLDKNSAQCKHCDMKFNLGTSLSTLEEHLRCEHPSLLEKKLETASAIIKNCTGEAKGADSDGQVEKDNFDGPLDNRRRRAGVWNFFVRLNKSIAQCKVCKKDLNYSASVSNLKRHLKAKHPTEHDQLTSPKVSFSWQKKEKSPPGEKRKRAAKIPDVKECVDENEALNSDSEYQPDTDDSENIQVKKSSKRVFRKRKSDVYDSFEKAEKRKSDVWHSFKKVDLEVAQCRLCEKNMNYKSCLSNLKRHLQTKHSMPTDSEGHEEVRSASKKGKGCADENEGHSDPSLEMEDSDSLQMVLEENCSLLFKRRKSDMWNHFVTLSKEMARCKHCHKNLNYRSSATNLKRHLRVKHPRAHAKLGQAKVVGKEAGASSSNVPTNQLTPSKTSKKENRNEIPAKRKSTAAVQKAGNKESLGKNKIPSANDEASDEDSSVDNGMPDTISDEDSADENEMPNDENSPEENERRPDGAVRGGSAQNSFTRLSNRQETSACKEAKSGASTAVNRSGKQTPSVPRVAIVKKAHSKRKRSRLWDFFTVLDEKFAECNTCKHKLVHKSGLSNLAKHYTMKHSLVDMASAAQAGMSEIEMAVNALNRSEAHEVASETPPIQTSAEPEPKRKVRKRKAENHWRCAIWKLFEKIDETFSQCKSCLKRISHRSTNANLLKHTRIKHPEVYFKFEERLKDFSHNVNLLVDHFFPESLISASTSGNSVPQTISSHESDHLPHPEYQIGENHQPHMYDYSFPVIFVQEEEGAVHTSAETNAATSVITSGHTAHVPPASIHAGGNNTHLPAAPYHMSGHSNHLPVPSGSHAQDLSSSINVGVNSSHLPSMGEGTAQVPSAPSDSRGSHQTQYMGESGTHLPVVPSSHNGINAHLPFHSAGGSGVPASFNVSGNYSQVLTTSFSVGGSVAAQPNDRLLGMVEESNQLLRGMQIAIERQSDVLIRLAESIATGMRAS